MCGRFDYDPIVEIIEQIFDSRKLQITNNINSKDLANHDVRPTTKIVTVLTQNGEKYLERTNWGIKFNDKSPLIFNSRKETIVDKPFWTKTFASKRAIVPMTSFYEWTGKKGSKTRYRIFLPDEKFFFVPALYHVKDDVIFTSLVTVPPNKFMEPVHNRMPVILKPENALRLLDAEINEAIDLCQSYEGEMDMEEYVEQK